MSIIAMETNILFWWTRRFSFGAYVRDPLASSSLIMNSELLKMFIRIAIATCFVKFVVLSQTPNFSSAEMNESLIHF